MTPVAAQAHNNSCHTQLLCPSDAHRYIWYGDAFGPYGSTRSYDPYGYYRADPAAYYTGYNPYGYYGADPYGYWGSPSGWGYPGYSGWGYGAWGNRGGGYGWGGSTGWGGYTGYAGYSGYSPQWYRYSWNCADAYSARGDADAYSARGDEAYVAYFGGREYRCDPAY
jgi:hypothetical protein